MARNLQKKKWDQESGKGLKSDKINEFKKEKRKGNPQDTRAKINTPGFFSGWLNPPKKWVSASWTCFDSSTCFTLMSSIYTLNILNSIIFYSQWSIILGLPAQILENYTLHIEFFFMDLLKKVQLTYDPSKKIFFCMLVQWTLYFR